jgi:hypothetical protein
MSCRLITEAGETVIENRTARSDGGVMVMRTFQGGERTYLLSYMRVGDKLLAEFAKHRSGPEPSAADGDAFLDSFQLGSGGSH